MSKSQRLRGMGMCGVFLFLFSGSSWIHPQRTCAWNWGLTKLEEQLRQWCRHSHCICHLRKLACKVWYLKKRKQETCVLDKLWKYVTCLCLNGIDSWNRLNSGRRSRFGWSTEACEWIASMRQRRDTRTETTVSKPISYRPVKNERIGAKGKNQSITKKTSTTTLAIGGCRSFQERTTFTWLSKSITCIMQGTSYMYDDIMWCTVKVWRKIEK